MQFQSAYKQHHCTESALLKVKNETLLNRETQKLTLLVLLDLSAGIDTVRRETLLSRLRSWLWVNGKALDWFVSYLADCLQRVAVNGGVSSSTFPLKQGIPQGSYLGPMLFTVYTSTLFAIVEKHLPRVHCYAHDSQLYLSFSPSVPGDDEVMVWFSS